MEEGDINIFNRSRTNATITPEQLETRQVVEITEDVIKNVTAIKSLPSYYDLSGKKILVIFNHFQFMKRKKKVGSFTFTTYQPLERSNTHKDVDRVTEVFTNLGFEVYQSKAYQDRKFEEIKEILSKLVSMGHKKTSCVAVVVLTHGDKDGVLEAYDQAYSITEIYKMFIHSHNNDLINKPKLFFVQACRGEEVDPGKLVRDGDCQDSALVLVPTQMDFLTVFSTVPGYVSFRGATGSWLMQILCSVIEKYHEEMDLLQMITLVNSEIAHHRVSSSSELTYDNKKQMPETYFTLTKLLKF